MIEYLEPIHWLYAILCGAIVLWIAIIISHNKGHKKHNISHEKMDRNYGGHSITHKKIEEIGEQNSHIIKVVEELASHICNTSKWTNSL